MYPVGKAQQQVLDALGRKAGSFGEAEAIFEQLGLLVASKRQGRTSVPVVRIKNRAASGWTAGGDGDSWQQHPALTDEQRAALAPFVMK